MPTPCTITDETRLRTLRAEIAATERGLGRRRAEADDMATRLGELRLDEAELREKLAAKADDLFEDGTYLILEPKTQDSLHPAMKIARGALLFRKTDGKWSGTSGPISFTGILHLIRSGHIPYFVESMTQEDL